MKLNFMTNPQEWVAWMSMTSLSFSSSVNKALVLSYLRANSASVVWFSSVHVALASP